jgi:hypothetical protein
VGVPDPWSLLATLTGTSAVALTTVLTTRQRAQLADRRTVRTAHDTHRTLWALAQIEDKLTAALVWVPLGNRALSNLKLRRSLRNFAESLGPARPSLRDAIARLHAHIEDFHAGSGTDPAAQATAARNAIEETRTLRRALERHAAEPLSAR